mmetsp:Transcript_6047/g.18681  ORF Transcript_6047/g.18681 Transcript_6047/m.18681 type:complete len:346 (-) Transcript_6047:1579-2616(-)
MVMGTVKRSRIGRPPRATAGVDLALSEAPSNVWTAAPSALRWPLMPANVAESMRTCPPHKRSEMACARLSSPPWYSTRCVTACTCTQSTAPVATAMRTRRPRVMTPWRTKWSHDMGAFLPLYTPGVTAGKGGSCHELPSATSGKEPWQRVAKARSCCSCMPATVLTAPARCVKSACGHGALSSASWTPRQKPTASNGSWKAMRNASPSVMTSYPKNFALYCRMRRSCRSMADDVASVSHSHSSVEPSTSVNTSVMSLLRACFPVPGGWFFALRRPRATRCGSKKYHASSAAVASTTSPTTMLTGMIHAGTPVASCRTHVIEISVSSVDRLTTYVYSSVHLQYTWL